MTVHGLPYVGHGLYRCGVDERLDNEREESGREIALIGLGGSGIRTMMALRALIEKEKAPALGVTKNSCRLLAIDSNSYFQDYFRDLSDGDREGILLNQNEYLGLLHSGENPWDKVTKDAQSNNPEAEKLLSQRPAILISRSPDRVDYKAMIYVSRERMKQAIREFLKNSSATNEKEAAPLRLMIASSLFGDTGSLSYLALLEILAELSDEIRFESIHAVLFEPESFEGYLRLNTFHTAKYLSVVKSISRFSFTEDINRIVPLQYLVSINPEQLLDRSTSVLLAFTETAKKVNELIDSGPLPEDLAKGDSGDPIVRIIPLNLEKCASIEKTINDRFGSDRRFIEWVRDFSD
jgi:hypothetical protein